MKILDTEIEFNFNDADDMERLENAIADTTTKLNTIKTKDRKTSEIIRETCKLIFNCFNIAFGEETDRKIFGEKVNLDYCIDAFQDLCNAREKQDKDLTEKIKRIEDKYSSDRVKRI